MSFLRNMSLFKQFAILLVVVLFVPLVTVTGLSFYRASNQMNGLISDLLDRIVSDVGIKLDNMIQDYSYVSFYLADSAEVLELVHKAEDDYYSKYEFKDWVENKTSFQSLLLRSPIMANLNIVGDTGIIYANEWSIPDDGDSLTRKGTIPLRAAHLREQFAQSGAAKVVTQTLDTNGKQTLYISIGRAVFARNESTPQGILFTDLMLGDLNKLWEEKDLKGGYIWVVDKTGQVIYHPSAEKIGTTLHQDVLQTLLSEERGSFISGQDSNNEINAFSTSKFTGWRVIATLPGSYYERPIGVLRQTILYSSVMIIPLTLWIGNLFIRSILKPLRDLKISMRRAEEERWSKLQDPLPRNEIGNLMSVYNRMIDTISELIEKVYKADIRHKEDMISKQMYEHQALQMQINPHFLYNTLGIINTYALLAGQEPIQEMITALSSMFRYSVKDLVKPVTLEEELGHVRNYLTVQKHKHSIMPEVEWKTAGFEEARILRLSLQPLVENVLEHAFPVVQSHHMLRITAERDGADLVVRVIDNGKGLTPSLDRETLVHQITDRSLGIGLTNVHRRYQLTCGEQYGLTVQGSSHSGTCITLRCPLIMGTEAKYLN